MQFPNNLASYSAEDLDLPADNLHNAPSKVCEDSTVKTFVSHSAPLHLSMGGLVGSGVARHTTLPLGLKSTIRATAHVSLPTRC